MERYIENYEAYHNKQLGKFGESVGGDKSEDLERRIKETHCRKKEVLGFANRRSELDRRLGKNRKANRPKNTGWNEDCEEVRQSSGEYDEYF